GVTGTVLVLDRRIVLRALVDVLDHQHDRRARGHLLASRLVGKHAGHDPDLVRLLPLRGEAGLAGPPAVELALDVRLAQRNAGRATVDHATDRRAVAFAKAGETKQTTERVERHGR